MDQIVQQSFNWIPWIIGAIISGLAFWLSSLWWGPIYNVWDSHKQGEADLMKAKNEQQIQIAKAQSRLDAAELNKKAAIVEAEAVATQIKTIGENLTTHDLYLKWQWINMMEKGEGKNKTIYVPTECNLPILAKK